MDRFFDSKNPVMQFLARLVDLALLNIFTVICAIPLVTAGAAMTAMNYVLLHLLRRDETYVTSMFRKSFKDNLKQGAVLGLLVIALAVITATDLWVMHASGSALMTMLMIIITVIAGFLFATSVYMFALQSRYENTIRGTIANAFRLSLANLPRTVAMMIVWAAWILLLVYLHKAAPLVILIYGFTIPGYLCTMLYDKVFERLESDED